jgi:hypothetical protein
MYCAAKKMQATKAAAVIGRRPVPRPPGGPKLFPQPVLPIWFAFKNFAEPVRALDEMHRVLRPGCEAVVVDLCKDASLDEIDTYVRQSGPENHWMLTRKSSTTLAPPKPKPGFSSPLISIAEITLVVLSPLSIRSFRFDYSATNLCPSGITPSRHTCRVILAVSLR